MRIACHYLEGKDIHPVTPGEVEAGSAPLDASASDASSTTGEDSEEVRTVGSDQVRTFYYLHTIFSPKDKVPVLTRCGQWLLKYTFFFYYHKNTGYHLLFYI